MSCLKILFRSESELVAYPRFRGTERLGVFQEGINKYNYAREKKLLLERIQGPR